MGVAYGVDITKLTTPASFGIVSDQLALYLDAGVKSSYQYGTSWKDLSGNNRNVTLYALGGTTYSTLPATAPTFNSDRFGQFDMDGVNDWGKFPATFTLPGTHTVSTWVKTTSSGSALGIVSHCSGGPVNVRYGISAGKMQYYYYSGAWYSASGTPSVNTGAWVNLVWAKTGTALKMYVNGSLTDSPTLVASIVENIGCVGSGWGPCSSDSYGAGTDVYGQVFSGSIGQVMIHTKELTSTEILNHFNIFKNRFR